MKMSRLISIFLLGAALLATPVYAQRGGGGRSGGGVSHSSSSSRGGGYSSSRSSSPSSSMSRSSSSYSSSSRSSSSYSSPSRSSSSYSSPSHSTSSSMSRSSSSYNGPSRSSSPSSSMSRSSSNSSRSSSSSSTRSNVNTSRGENVLYGESPRSRTGSVPNQVRSRSNAPTSRGEATRGETMGRTGERGGNPGSNVGNTTGRPSGIAPAPNGGYGRPGHPGPMPPSHRPMHPAPYFWHPHYHYMVHCHQLFWDPFPPRPFYWPGFWYYCDSYWYDYHVTDVVVVRDYVRETYNVDLITYAFSGDYMYALINDRDGHTYIQIYDKNDKLLAEQQVSRKYCKMEVDPENGGCWIMKKRDKDPLLFFYSGDGQLLIYEAD